MRVEERRTYNRKFLKLGWRELDHYNSMASFWVLHNHLNETLLAVGIRWFGLFFSSQWYNDTGRRICSGMWGNGVWREAVGRERGQGPFFAQICSLWWASSILVSICLPDKRRGQPLAATCHRQWPFYALTLECSLKSITFEHLLTDCSQHPHYFLPRVTT